MVQIIQYRDKCIGCYACVVAAPHRWRISTKDGKCTLIDGKEKKGVFNVTVPDEELGANLLAALNCPVKIIKVKQL